MKKPEDYPKHYNMLSTNQNIAKITRESSWFRAQFYSEH